MVTEQGVTDITDIHRMEVETLRRVLTKIARLLGLPASPLDTDKIISMMKARDRQTNRLIAKLERFEDAERNHKHTG